jgi:hypothetical protein
MPERAVLVVGLSVVRLGTRLAVTLCSGELDRELV